MPARVISLLKSLIRDRLAERFDLPTIPAALQRLARNGLTPESIFDVGAYHGDFAAMALAVWPAARIACFEPLPAGRARIAELQRRFPAIDIHPALVGATAKDRVELHVAETSTSLLRDAHNESFPVQVFPQVTLDHTIEAIYAGRAPDLLKIDVQGFEMEVLKGTARSIGKVRAVLTEFSLLDLHENVPLMHEVVAWLAERGFVAYDICGITRRPMDDALWQADMVFVRKDDALRRDKGYFPGKSWFRD